MTATLRPLPPRATAVSETPARSLVPIALDRLVPSPWQPRQTFPEGKLEELALSIRTSGLVQPIVVRPTASGLFEIVAGERRVRACERLAREDGRFSRVPAIVQMLTDEEARVAALVENLVREDLNPVERGEALRSLKGALGTTWEGVARRVGVSKRAVLFQVGLVKLRAEFRDAVAVGRLTEKHARALRKLPQQGSQAWELFELLMAKPEVTGDGALAIASVLRKDPAWSAEEAWLWVQDPKKAPSLPKGRKGPAATPARQVIRGLKTFLKAADDFDGGALQPAEADEVLRLFQEVRPRMARILSSLQGGRRR